MAWRMVQMRALRQVADHGAIEPEPDEYRHRDDRREQHQQDVREARA